MEKQKNNELTSASESEAPKRIIKAKPMPKKQKDAASAASSDQPVGTYDTVTGIDTQPKSPYGHRRQVVKTRARREMNTQAKELFRDADAAQKFFTKLKRILTQFSGFLALRVHNAVRILPTVTVQRPCSGATLVALPAAWNAAPTAQLATTVLLIISLS